MLCEAVNNIGRLMSVDQNEGLRGDHLGPQELIDLVELKTRSMKLFIDWEDRLSEVRDGIQNQQRVENGYYPRALLIQQEQDRVFATFAPASFKAISNKVDSINQRWKKTVQLSNKITDFLREERIDTGVIDCRAKSVFSIWQKVRNYDLDIDEIYDQVGIRIIADNISHAYEIAHKLMTKFNLVTEESFKRSKAKHNPIRDNLLNPNDRWYGAIHLTFYNDSEEFDTSLKNPRGVNFNKLKRGIFDVQITTKDFFLQMAKRYKDHPYTPSHLRVKTEREKISKREAAWHVDSRKLFDILGFEHWIEAYESWETGLSKTIYRICTGETIDSGVVVGPNFYTLDSLFDFARSIKNQTE